MLTTIVMMAALSGVPAPAMTPTQKAEPMSSPSQKTAQPMAAPTQKSVPMSSPVAQKDTYGAEPASRRPILTILEIICARREAQAQGVQVNAGPVSVNVGTCPTGVCLTPRQARILNRRLLWR